MKFPGTSTPATTANARAATPIPTRPMYPAPAFVAIARSTARRIAPANSSRTPRTNIEGAIGSNPPGCTNRTPEGPFLVSVDQADVATSRNDS